MVINDSFYLNLALKEAWKYQGLTYPNPAVGCAIVNQNGILLSVEAHKKAGESHAELEATKVALLKLNPSFVFPKNPNQLHEFILKNHNNLLKNSTFYVTLEPCMHKGKTPSCALLLKTLGVKKVVIGWQDTHEKASGGVDFLKQHNIDAKIILDKKYFELLEPFLLWQKNKFIFFKLAMSINGIIDGGAISCPKSQTFCHHIRDKCDLLAIGGNTVRVDKPTLDARLSGGRAPNILIYSKQQNFNPAIPLFSVPNREVRVANSFSLKKSEKLIMIEGGEGMLKALEKKFSHLLIFHSSNFKIGKSPQILKNLQCLYRGTIEDDSFGWYKIKNI